MEANKRWARIFNPLPHFTVEKSWTKHSRVKTCSASAFEITELNNTSRSLWWPESSMVHSKSSSINFSQFVTRDVFLTTTLRIFFLTPLLSSVLSICSQPHIRFQPRNGHWEHPLPLLYSSLDLWPCGHSRTFLCYSTCAVGIFTFACPSGYGLHTNSDWNSFCVLFPTNNLQCRRTTMILETKLFWQTSTLKTI